MGYIDVTAFCAPYIVKFRGRRGDTSSVGIQFYYSTNSWNTSTLIGTAGGNPAGCALYSPVYLTSGTSLSVKVFRTDSFVPIYFNYDLSATCPSNTATTCQYDYGSVTSDIEISLTAYIDTGSPLNC
jgi:hypothetical protein